LFAAEGWRQGRIYFHQFRKVNHSSTVSIANLHFSDPLNLLPVIVSPRTPAFFVGMLWILVLPDIRLISKPDIEYSAGSGKAGYRISGRVIPGQKNAALSGCIFGASLNFLHYS
jgi:hypothetical protein